jgi:hypothetical protein
VFVETITIPRPEWEEFAERLRMLSDPPEALIATIAWDAGEGLVTAVNLWDSPAAVGDFYVARVQEALQEVHEPTAKPIRRGPPIAVYLRSRVLGET